MNVDQQALELLARFLQEPMHDLNMEHEVSLSTAQKAVAYALSAQPTQAVDLGQFREAIYAAWEASAAGGKTDLQLGKLLALIDSQK
ncbi:MAG: hypothetical protein RR877_10045 [Aurantimicrobium sp.]|uniref:hypothetical protein n=1 Tax=Aurantimicrobium sp. TaxID=1930784 RepID=UPI002FCBB11F